MIQMSIVAICDRGHIQDFPWNQWVHQSTAPECTGQLEFGSTGAGGLRGLKVSCKLCKKSRNLENTLSAEPDGERTHLTSSLDQAHEYRCQGKTPWLGNSVTHECGRPIRGALRSSTNIYYAQLASAIYLPRKGKSAAPGLIDLLSRPPILTLRQIVGSHGDRWLPAYIVHGEGIFLQLNEQALQAWETRRDVRSRVDPLVARYADIQQNRRL